MEWLWEFLEDYKKKNFGTLNKEGNLKRGGNLQEEKDESKNLSSFFIFFLNLFTIKIIKKLCLDNGRKMFFKAAFDAAQSVINFFIFICLCFKKNFLF